MKRRQPNLLEAFQSARDKGEAGGPFAGGPAPDPAPREPSLFERVTAEAPKRRSGPLLSPQAREQVLRLGLFGVLTVGVLWAGIWLGMRGSEPVRAAPPTGTQAGGPSSDPGSDPGSDPATVGGATSAGAQGPGASRLDVAPTGSGAAGAPKTPPVVAGGNAAGSNETPASGLYNPANRYTVLAITYKDSASHRSKAEETWRHLVAQGLPAFPPVKEKGKANVVIVVGAAPRASELHDLLVAVQRTAGPNGSSFDFDTAYVRNIDDIVDRD